MGLCVLLCILYAIQINAILLQNGRRYYERPSSNQAIFFFFSVASFDIGSVNLYSISISQIAYDGDALTEWLSIFMFFFVSF